MMAIHEETPVDGLILAAPDWIWPGSGARSTDQRFADAYRAFLAVLMDGLPATCWFAVVTHRSAIPAMRRWLETRDHADRVRPIEVDDALRFSAWVSDVLVFCEDEDELVVVSPCQFPRASDAELATRIASALDLRHVRSRLFFQGGNLLMTTDGLLVGADDVAASVAVIPNGSRAECLHAYAMAFAGGAPVLELGAPGRVYGERDQVNALRPGWIRRLHPGTPPAGRQPLYHIDLAVSALPGGRLLVGDAGRAKELCPGSDPDPGVADGLDALAEGLAAAGRDVVRAPLAFLPIEDVERLRVTHIPCPSCNVIADFGSRTVFMPSATDLAPLDGLDEIDARHVELWRGAGFSPVPIAGLEPIVRRLGGPRCLVKAVPKRT